MVGDPRSGSKVWKAPDREIGKPGENRGKVIAHRDLHPTAAFHDRENRRNLRSRLWAADVQPVLSTQSHGTHRVFRKVIAQLKFRIFQKSCKFPPKRERVLASLAECAGRRPLPQPSRELISRYNVLTEFFCHACKKFFDRILSLVDYEEGDVLCPH